MPESRLFVRVIECDDGTWACNNGRAEYDRHALFDEALDHMTNLRRRVDRRRSSYIA